MSLHAFKQTIKPYIPFRARHYYRTKLAKSTKDTAKLDSRASDALNTLNRYIALTTPTTDRARKKQLLSQNLKLIEIEISSFCNRTCWFCPNSIIDRKSHIELPEELFLKCIDNLAEIDYSGMLNFHRFNETLANKELILKRLHQARSRLPRATLGIFSNGDYLTREYLDALADAGASFLLMSYYATKDEPFDVKTYIKPAMARMGKKLGLPYITYIDTPQEYGVSFVYEKCKVFYRSWNPALSGGDRGGVIEKIKQRSQSVRQKGCYYPLMDMYIDYNGLVMPCCNLRSDVKAHKNYILGDIAKQDLFDLFMNDNFIAMRKVLTPNGEKGGACASCHYEKPMRSFIDPSSSIL